MPTPRLSATRWPRAIWPEADSLRVQRLWRRTWLGTDATHPRRRSPRNSAPRTTLRGPRLRANWPTLLPDGATLYAGNSMPVRDLDTFFPAATRVRFLPIAARTASTAWSRARSASAAVDAGPLVLVIGDLSFYHDLNGLLAAKQHRPARDDRR